MDTMDNKCKFCGASLPDGSSACPVCGRAVSPAPADHEVDAVIAELRAGAANAAAPQTPVPPAPAPFVAAQPEAPAQQSAPQAAPAPFVAAQPEAPAQQSAPQAPSAPAPFVAAQPEAPAQQSAPQAAPAPAPFVAPRPEAAQQPATPQPPAFAAAQPAPVPPPAQPAAPQAPAFSPAPPAAAQPPYMPQQPQSGPQFYSPPQAQPFGTQPAGQPLGAPGAQQGFPAQQQAQGQYGAAPPSPPPYPQQFNQPGGPGGNRPSKKKTKAGPIIAICSVVAALAIAAVVIFAVVLPKQERKSEYSTLVQDICGSSTPAQVAKYLDELNEFDAANPGMVESDLKTLVEVCDEYENAVEDEYKYKDAISGLEKSEKSSNADIAACASTLLDDVDSEYDAYQTASASSSSAPAPPTSEPPSSEPPATEEGADPLEVLNSGMGYIEYDGVDYLCSFDARNNSDKAITYFETVFFFFDANGKPVNFSDGTNYLVLTDSSTYLAPGATHTPEEDGYWPYTGSGLDESKVAMCVPFVSYVEFGDGSSWGYPNHGGSNTTLNGLIEDWSLLAEIMAAINV